MSDYEVEVRVEVKEVGDFSTRLMWGTGDIRLEAPNLQSAIIEALRQAPGEAAVDLNVRNGA